MSEIREVFAKGKAFIPFITAGDPSLEVTEKLVIAMAEKGADIIELGIPFSDPVAEGPVIQQADLRALKAGTTTEQIFEMVRRVRKQCNIPLAFMTYMNPIFAYGTKRFLNNCKNCEIQGIIVPDLPFEEKTEVLSYCQQYNIDLISLIAPTSDERVQKIAGSAEGFLYIVSSMGVTGVRQKITTDIGAIVEEVRKVSDIPCAVGFGISTPEQAKKIIEFADGVIVGSAIVKMVAQYGENCVPYIADYVEAMKRAII